MRNRTLLLLVEVLMEGFDSLIQNEANKQFDVGLKPPVEKLDRALWNKLDALRDEEKAGA